MNPPSQNSGAARDVDLERLLRAAAKAKDEAPAEMPFGFDSRVIAHSRRNGNGPAMAGLVRRHELAAEADNVIADAGAWYASDRNDEDVEASGYDFPVAACVL